MSTAVAPTRTRPARLLDLRVDPWRLGELLLAGFTVVLVAARISIGGNLVASDALAAVMLPLWLPVLARYKGAITLLCTGIAACFSSWVLTRYASADHYVSMKLNTTIIKMLLSVLLGTSLVLWARERLPLRWLYLCFGIGMLIAGPSSKQLFAENPWKFGFSVPLTIMVVGFLASEKRPRLTLGLLALFGAICTVTDARSNFAVLLLTVVMVGWRLIPAVRRRRSSTGGILLGLVVVAVLAYYLVQTAILGGLLGEETRARSEEQIALSGSLLAGARPEMGASRALFAYRPTGFGGGTFLNTQDLLVAKNGMYKLHYDPLNGYVDHFMFGRGTELHSSVFDLWSWCGYAGLAFAAVIAALVLVGLAHHLQVSPVSGSVTVFAALLTLWNLPFSPWLASIPITTLVLATGMVRRPPRAPRNRVEAVRRARSHVLAA